MSLVTVSSISHPQLGKHHRNQLGSLRQRGQIRQTVTCDALGERGLRELTRYEIRRNALHEVAEGERVAGRWCWRWWHGGGWWCGYGWSATQFRFDRRPHASIDTALVFPRTIGIAGLCRTVDTFVPTQAARIRVG